VGELAAEVVAMARAARRSLDGDGPWTLVLAGGVFADPAGRFLAAVRKAEPDVEREFALAVVDAPPVAGAALLGLDRIDAAVGAGTVRRAFLAGPSPEVIDLR
ncbi:hypothetical protein ACFFNX_37265, partial [Actinoallomurus acaciae]